MHPRGNRAKRQKIKKQVTHRPTTGTSFYLTAAIAPPPLTPRRKSLKHAESSRERVEGVRGWVSLVIRVGGSEGKRREVG